MQQQERGKLVIWLPHTEENEVGRYVFNSRQLLNNIRISVQPHGQSQFTP